MVKTKTHTYTQRRSANLTGLPSGPLWPLGPLVPGGPNSVFCKEKNHLHGCLVSHITCGKTVLIACIFLVANQEHFWCCSYSQRVQREEKYRLLLHDLHWTIKLQFLFFQNSNFLKQACWMEAAVHMGVISTEGLFFVVSQQGSCTVLQIVDVTSISVVNLSILYQSLYIGEKTEWNLPLNFLIVSFFSFHWCKSNCPPWLDEINKVCVAAVSSRERASQLFKNGALRLINKSPQFPNWRQFCSAESSQTHCSCCTQNLLMIDMRLCSSVDNKRLNTTNQPSLKKKKRLCFPSSHRLCSVLFWGRQLLRVTNK